MAKILFVSSGGGHYNELMKLKPLMDKHDSIIVSKKYKDYVLAIFETKLYEEFGII